MSHRFSGRPLGSSAAGKIGPVTYLRYEADRTSPGKSPTGLFGLANGLARSGRLTPEDWALWRAGNDWYDAAYPDPGTVDPTLFDKTVNPVVSCWFQESAAHLLARVPAYLALLDRYGVGWVERRSADPGVVLYADDVQIVDRAPERRAVDHLRRAAIVARTVSQCGRSAWRAWTTASVTASAGRSA